MPESKGKQGALEKDPLWYKRGVIYEVHVRAFHDDDGNGSGDFRGLTRKLEYLRDLGITAIWLLPFYPSPLKDDGYDIADYFDVHPMYGTLQDFKVFLRAAHRHGLRVITELVLNHTSDQHPWFQRARRSKPGSQWRNFYVWSDTPEKYKSARIIFKDTEVSNWTWDHAANAYYWHRFYSHQPDLNFENPAVHREMLKALDFWLDLGVDGLRLDAIPYLYEREGTSCENLPETHEFLKMLRRHVDEKYSDRMLLAEANQWPDDAVAYFGGGRGDECHMAFHFPLMPRLFMSLRMEDRVPVVDMLEQTPAIPELAQWALFLRNHDELTLEMVTDEERDYMYRVYASAHQARINLGIRRRLAPLLGNDRRRIELLNALLFSLPGTPVIYYGDEIGMGDNIYLGDRNGVRTPMQWSADKNAGFSRANPQSLYLPINLDPENHYEAVNVEVEERNPHSLLWWMKRLIALRKRWKAFGLGTVEFLRPENRKIFACVRRYQDEKILIVANLSRFVQPAELELSGFQSLTPVELLGRTEFPVITDKPYFLTLGPHAFFWLSLEAKTVGEVETTGAPKPEPAMLNVDEDWEEILNARNHSQFESALQRWLVLRRWFAGRARTVKSVRLQEIIPVPVGSEKVFLTFLQVDYVQTDAETYTLPLACAFGDAADAISKELPALVIARLKLNHPNQTGVLYDAIGNKPFCRELLEIISRRRALDGTQGELTGTHTAVLRKLRIESGLALEPSVVKAVQSNSSVVFGERLILKLFRRLEGGVNPDLETSRVLTSRKFTHAPALAGALEYNNPRGESSTAAILTTFVPKCQDAWEYTQDTLGRFYERVQSLPAQNRAAPALANEIVKLAGGELPAVAADMIGSYAEAARVLGEYTAALHITLASETKYPEFLPEAFTPHFQRGLFQSMRNLTRQNFQLLNQRLKRLPPEIQPLAQQVLGLETEILKRFRAICDHPIRALRTRRHGDYHLGQLLYDGKDFWIIDFEGEASRPLSERQIKHSPLRDVADMIRSFDYAAQAALRKQIEKGSLPPAQAEATAAWGRFWTRAIGAIFFKAYRRIAGVAAFLPTGDDDLRVMLDAYLLRRAIYEMGSELDNRPDWLKIPLLGILDLMNQEPAPAEKKTADKTP